MEPDLGFGFDIIENAECLSHWCARHPSLDDYADGTEQALSAGVRCQIMLQIADGLLYLREHGIVHGDLRLNNVFLQVQVDSSVVVKLSEYGLIRAR